MNNLIKDFFEAEKNNNVTLQVLPNGVKYLHNEVTQWNIFHESFKPLTDEQIDMLQANVNQAQMAAFVFPEWYRDLLRTTNGFNLFFDKISFYGEQTPLVWSENDKTYTKTLIERNNPNWMAPFDLCFTNSIKFDESSKKRWLTIGGYSADGTQIVWDYKTQKIVAMYRLPVTTSIKALKKLKEADYEKLICSQWNSFDEFFVQETARLKKVIEKYGVDKEKGGFYLVEKTLPVGHKDYEE